MEQALENMVNNFLEKISLGLYVFSIALGVVLIILGILLFLKRKDSQKKKIGGWICLGFGVVAISSGFLQMYGGR